MIRENYKISTINEENELNIRIEFLISFSFPCDWFEVFFSKKNTFIVVENFDFISSDFRLITHSYMYFNRKVRVWILDIMLHSQHRFV